ncbi:pre-toxin TG domain-containing protein [Paenibacillus sp. Z6-24]
MNRDVLTGSIDNGLTMNRYAYVNGSPVSYIDPFGLSAEGSSWLEIGLSLGADATPFVGTVKGLQEIFTGVDLITGEQLSVADRVATGGGTLLSWFPGGKIGGKFLIKETIDGGAWVISKIGKSHADDVIGTAPKLTRPTAGDNMGLMLSKEMGEVPTPKYVPKDASGNPMPLPRTDGKMINGTVHVPESMNPHTQIGWQKGRKGDYIQTLEWGRMAFQ